MVDKTDHMKGAANDVVSVFQKLNKHLTIAIPVMMVLGFALRKFYDAGFLRPDCPFHLFDGLSDDGDP